MHVVDAAGNDFKVRCIAGALSFHYEYSVSFPNGTSEEISTCIYDLGFNDAELIYSGAMAQTTAPNGTPVINVGSLLIVEHSNEEGTGSAGAATPKPGGEDFHMVYDFRQKFRYRLNTVIGTGPQSTTYFASQSSPPTHRILHADAMLLSTSADFKAALAGDTAFRRIDFPETEPPPEEFQFQDVDSDYTPMGYGYLGEGGRSGGIIFDATLRGSIAAIRTGGIEVAVPAAPDRTVSTLALSRRLFQGGGSRLRISVDGRQVRAVTRETESMVVIELHVNEKRHELLIVEGRKAPTRTRKRT